MSYSHILLHYAYKWSKKDLATAFIKFNGFIWNDIEVYGCEVAIYMTVWNIKNYMKCLIYRVFSFIYLQCLIPKPSVLYNSCCKNISNVFFHNIKVLFPFLGIENSQTSKYHKLVSFGRMVMMILSFKLEVFRLLSSRAVFRNS